MTPDRLYAEYDEEITALRLELCDCEDHDNNCAARSKAIRSHIRDLQFERDLLPPQRQPKEAR